MKKFTMMTAALALGLAATPAMAEQDWSAWDGNGDGVIDNNEFNAGFGDSGVYGNWDADGDGLLSQDEFNEGVYGSYDQDNSGQIEEPEFGDLGDDMGDGGLWDV